MKKLPIDVLPDGRPGAPPLFRWSAAAVGTLGADRSVECEGELNTGAGAAVAALIEAYRQLEKENGRLRHHYETTI